jgi:hypothetical protein
MKIPYPFTVNFFKLETQNAQFLNYIGSVNAKHNKKAKKKSRFGKLRHFEWLVKIMIFEK